ncbi:MAG: bifunctional 4-hydroxy-2-oxoglutarate aldolase/2-dehydro-3-deoxy-phosphogluconate aldolase [Candidatus Omnitrophota bacterium]
MDINRFKELPIMGIVRGVKETEVEPLIETVISAGLKTIEFAMNVPDAGQHIKRAKKAANDRMAIGAGTVLTERSLRSALDSGASFIVMPTLVPAIMEFCTKEKIPVFPGALTPQEIYNAWNAGATMVKVFPVKFFGPDYIKEIKGPLDKIELLACGGVRPDNISSFLSNGASAVAFGGSVFKGEWLEKGKFSLIAECIRSLIAGLKNS